MIGGVDMEDIILTLDANDQEIDMGMTEQLVVGAGTKDYEKLINKPRVNTIELVGDKSFADLGLRPLTNLEIEALLQ